MRGMSWRTRARAVAVAVVALGALVVTGAIADSVDLLTPQQAAQQLALTDPQAVGDTPIAGDSSVPAVRATGDGFVADASGHPDTM